MNSRTMREKGKKKFQREDGNAWVQEEVQEEGKET